MSNETTLTIAGNLVDDPELRFTPSGEPVAKFRIASTPAVLRQAERPVEGRRHAVPDRQRVAPGRRERRREHDPRHPGNRARPAPAAVVRDQGRSPGPPAPATATAADPWASDRTGGYSDEPPF